MTTTTAPKPKRASTQKGHGRKPASLIDRGTKAVKTVNIHAAKTHLSSLIEEAAAGTDVIIAKAGKPVARLVPVKKNNFASTLGMFKGQTWMSDDFDAPLPPEILKGFGIEE